MVPAQGLLPKQRLSKHGKYSLPVLKVADPLGLKSETNRL